VNADPTLASDPRCTTAEVLRSRCDAHYLSSRACLDSCLRSRHCMVIPTAAVRSGSNLAALSPTHISARVETTRC